MSELAVGIMSGTSGDGVDSALIEVEWRRDRIASVDVIAHAHDPFAPDLRESVIAAGAGQRMTTAELARLHAALGDAYAEVAAKWIKGVLIIRVIGVHGQTVAHLPGDRATLQIGDAARVALRTKVATACDFRSADIAAGGEGAPLTPFADHVLFGSGAPRVVLNLGGIANVTLLPDKDRDHVTGFDTGPGNMVIDAVARIAGSPFDKDGVGARRGRIVERALAAALAHSFFSREAPKSTGREEFGQAFAEQLVASVRAEGGSLDDALATATALTTLSVADAIRRATPHGTEWHDVLVGGGGSANPALMEALRRALAPVAVRTTDEADVPAAAREAAAFAILALYRIRELPNTLPRVTGARHAVSAGAVHRP